MFVSGSPQESPLRSSATGPHITTSYSLSIYPFLHLQILISLSFSSFLPTAPSPSFSPGTSHCCDKSEKKKVGTMVQCNMSSYFSSPPLLSLSQPASLPHTVIYLRWLTLYPLSLLSFTSYWDSSPPLAFGRSNCWWIIGIMDVIDGRVSKKYVFECKITNYSGQFISRQGKKGQTRQWNYFVFLFLVVLKVKKTRGRIQKDS